LHKHLYIIHCICFMAHFRLFFLLILMFLCGRNSFSQSAQKGTAFYSDSAKSNNLILGLAGKWQFYYGGFLSAQEMKHLAPQEKQYISVPSNWNDLFINGKRVPVFGAGTYFLQIVIGTAKEEKVHSYSFYIGDITTAYKLYVNDHLVMRLGMATTSAAGSKPMFCPQIGSFESREDTLDVILHVSNYFYPHYTGVSRNILFGTVNNIHDHVFFRQALYLFMLSAYIILFIFQLMVYFSNKKEKSHLLIAFLSLFFWGKILLDGEVTIFHFFPHFNYFIGYRFWIFTLCSIPLAFGLVRDFFPQELKRWVFRMVCFFYSIVGLLIFTLNLHFILQNIDLLVFPTLLSVVYLTYVLVAAVVKKRRTSIIHLISFFILLGSFLKDLLFITKPDSLGLVSSFGVFQYIVIQSFLVWFKFAGAHQLTIELKEQLMTANKNLEETVSLRTKELQKAKDRLEKLNRQKDFFITNLSHDLKNSFNILINFAKIMKEEPNLDKEQQNIMEIMHESAKKGYQVLENILEWGKVQVSNHAEASLVKNLSEIVTYNLELFSDTIYKKGLKTQITIDDTLSFNCQKGQLNSILRNLISNAVKFSKTGGTLIISNQLSDQSVQITVQDEGMGIPAEMQATLFSATINNKRRGTSGEEGSGLGLLIIKELAENNQGSITCTSNTDTGASFIITFPLTKE
jgi:signal transduction histidine kinase